MLPSAMPGSHACFWASLPEMRIGLEGSLLNSTIRAEDWQYLAISSIATTRPRAPAPEPP